ncbi:uncharacterized protein SCODWIG_00421 [Saccharomycodes ludwigii]|uniref:Protein-lysine N-methyltransferase EFM2 n=1 Tax=Saccharomycodes ludwigii TaxID=36035 RepID=A0A376B3F5_9ASCO|nr:hypothetical protein SCDLUD_003564 [Saccharomycodes ludwigii]KAH3900573.1 hypothetical protein SCDLUD_003564 [Saccharomycodes ludwigii]SSD58660.1 uncharacterized protein SCODWIG_00421 [Saccharomycodes ludwigii]
MDFDVLDYISKDEKPHIPTNQQNEEILFKRSTPIIDHNIDTVSSSTENTYDTRCQVVPLQLLDLPPVKTMPYFVIFTILKLLKPSVQLNFSHTQSSQDTDNTTGLPNLLETYFYDHNEEEKKNITNLIDITMLWFKKNWNFIFNLASINIEYKQKFVNKIRSLLANNSKASLLSYYTNIIAFCENSLDTEMASSMDLQTVTVTKEHILRECSLRIAENCGRTAQPSTSRFFQLDNMCKRIELFEPGLTNDNLGFKTWGASLKLSQIICNYVFPTDYLYSKNNFNCANDANKNYKILELGAGTGLVGISFICKNMLDTETKNTYAANGIDVYLTDLPEITENLWRNVKLNYKMDDQRNSTNNKVIVDVLDWTDPSAFIKANRITQFDVILIADPIYSPQHPYLIVNMMKTFLRKPRSDGDNTGIKGGVVLLEIPVRDKYEKERQLLWDLLDQNGLQIIHQNVETGVDDFGPTKYIFSKIAWKGNM